MDVLEPLERDGSQLELYERPDALCVEDSTWEKEWFAVLPLTLARNSGSAASRF